MNFNTLMSGASGLAQGNLQGDLLVQQKQQEDFQNYLRVQQMKRETAQNQAVQARWEAEQAQTKLKDTAYINNLNADNQLQARNAYEKSVGDYAPADQPAFRQANKFQPGWQDNLVTGTPAQTTQPATPMQPDMANILRMFGANLPDNTMPKISTPGKPFQSMDEWKAANELALRTKTDTPLDKGRLAVSAAGTLGGPGSQSLLESLGMHEQALALNGVVPYRGQDIDDRKLRWLAAQRQTAWNNAFKSATAENTARFRSLDLKLRGAMQGLNIDPAELGITLDLPDPSTFGAGGGSSTPRVTVSPGGSAGGRSNGTLPAPLGITSPAGTNVFNELGARQRAEAAAKATKTGLDITGKKYDNQKKADALATKANPKFLEPDAAAKAAALNPAELAQARFYGFRTNAIRFAPDMIRQTIQKLKDDGWLVAETDKKGKTTWIPKTGKAGGYLGGTVGYTKTEPGKAEIKRVVDDANARYKTINIPKGAQAAPAGNGKPSKAEIIKGARARHFTPSLIKEALKEAGY